jgi:hypothetical protein
LLTTSAASGYFRVQAQIEHVWADLAHDPEHQALDCALLCEQEAPQLAAWLKARIYAQLPDSLLKELLFHAPTDGRIRALSLLSALTETRHPSARSIPTTRPKRAGHREPQQSTGFQEAYQQIFGVRPQIVASECRLRSDPELGRLTVALSRAHQYRFWIVGREMTRQADGSGCIPKADLRAKLAFYQVDASDRHIRRILSGGEGLFWRQDRKHPERLYLISWKQVSLKLLALAEAQKVEIGFNRPGAHEQLVDVSGSLQAWEARLYAAWIAHRDGAEGISISRACQAGLFGRSEKTIRQWEKRYLRTLVTKRADYEQHPDDQRTPDELYDLQNYIPDHAEPYTAATKQGRVQRRAWQRPNTYTSSIDSHTHHGQARKVRKAVNDAMSAEPDGGPWRSNYTVEQHLKRVKSRKFRQGEDGDVMRPVHVYIGLDRRHGVGVWELMPPDPAAPYPKTRPNERRARR